MRRRAYLGLIGGAAAGLSGCVNAPGAGGGDDPTSADAATTEAPVSDPSPETPTATATPSGASIFEGYETTDVRVRSPGGDVLGRLTAAIADTRQLRITGLSDTAFLPENWGMLFVYGAVGDHTYVMREMDFGLDIVYVDGDGTITRIHHAPAPGPGEDGESQRYPGRGQYVLEVNYGWTEERGVTEGDVLEFTLPQ